MLLRVTLALGISLASVLLGYLLVGHFIMATLTWTGMLGPTGGRSWFSAVYYLTHSWATLLLVGWTALVLALGASGFVLAGRDPRRRGPSALSGMAARFALCGLVGGVIDFLLLAILLIVGWS
jgi:hypothetical protein